MTEMHIKSLDLNQLRLIEALARTGNLGEAAEEIGFTQSAASHALARLRHELQDAIFVRASRGMRPTPYGAHLAASVREALQALLTGLNRHPDFVPGTANKTFNVIMSDVGQFLYLPKLLARLSIEAPAVTFRAHEMPAKAPHLILESGEVNLAVGAYTKLIVGCRQQRLYRERYVCVVRKDHPQFRHGMTADAFCRVPHALVDPSGHVHEQLDRWLAQQKVSRTAKLYVPYFLPLLPVITGSDLLVVMSNRLAEAFSQIAPLKIMPPPTKLPIYTVSLFWHERFHRDPANLWLRRLYIDLFSDTPQRASTNTG
jgi:DNA-binding transcriptional LysR family regulator